MRSLFYRSEGYGPYEVRVPDTLHIDAEDQATLADVVEEAASDFYTNRDGFEAKWPRRFTLHEQKGAHPIAEFVVEVHSEPVFSAIPHS